ncbi:MAG: GtrA family protein [Chloroflexota bacterium]
MTHIFNDANERIRFLKFATVGAIGTVVDFAVYNFLNLAIGLAPVVSQAISFALAVVNNFLWNRHWTYPESRGKAVHHQLAQFGLINVVGLLIRTPIIAWMESPLGDLAARLGVGAEAAVVVGHNAALAIAIGIVMLWNYFANRYWTYNDIDER